MKFAVILFLFCLLGTVVLADPMIDLAASALNASEEHYKVLMQNVSNSKTPGYRELNVTEGSSSRSKVISKPYINFTQGDFINTGRKFDFAIEGKGFFSVRTPHGVTLYTRDGRFALDDEHRLVTYSGRYLLLGESGPIIIDESTEKASITETGKIMMGTNVLDRIRVVDFSEYSYLTPLSGSFFYVADMQSAVETVKEDYRIRIGVVEGPNINLSRQLSELPSVQKTYDASSRIIQFRLKSMSSSLEMGKVQ